MTVCTQTMFQTQCSAMTAARWLAAQTRRRQQVRMQRVQQAHRTVLVWRVSSTDQLAPSSVEVREPCS